MHTSLSMRIEVVLMYTGYQAHIKILWR